MTTGRINQVAFLADAVVERGRRTRRIPRPAATTAVVRFERLTPAFGQTRVGDPLPSLGIPHPRNHRCSCAETATRIDREGPGTRAHRFAVRPATHPPGEGRRGANSAYSSFRIPFRRYATQETRKTAEAALLSCRSMKGRARKEVAARAGIQPTQTRRPPPTRRHVRNGPSKPAAHRQPAKVTEGGERARAAHR